MSRQRLRTALRTKPTDRCADGCDTTRAMFAAAIEREVAGEAPDRDRYARLDTCPACAQESSAALDLAFRLDRDEARAADVAPVRLPWVRRPSQRQTEEGGDQRRAAEDSSPYGEDKA